jgi:gliding motility-associated lipoprotein GldD
MFKRFRFFLICKWLITSLIFVTACNSNYTPKPTGYYRIPTPEKEYRMFDETGYPFSFQYPVYALWSKDSTFFGDETENPWWGNIDIPFCNAHIYLSYKELQKYELQKLLNDAYNLTNKHTIKAENIKDSLLSNPQGVHGMFFRVGGNVATTYQFFLTDSTHHFIRGALYFDSAPNADSLMPLTRFLAEDMLHMVQTWRWK